jgi:hypothetical protein
MAKWDYCEILEVMGNVSPGVPRTRIETKDILVRPTPATLALGFAIVLFSLRITIISCITGVHSGTGNRSEHCIIAANDDGGNDAR